MKSTGFGLRFRMLAMAAGASLLTMQAHAALRPVVMMPAMLQEAAPIERAPAAAPAASGSITLPAGTVVQLTLVSTIRSKASHIGEAVRAQVAFPVAAGDRVAIPAGTFVEGQLVQTKSPVKKVKKGQPKPQDLIVRFTRLVFANGYIAPLDGTNMAAIVNPEPGALLAFGGAGEGMGFAGQSTYPVLPPLPPLPDPTLEHHGPNPVAMSLGIVGGFVLLTLGTLLLARHGASSRAENTDTVLFDAGWQFEMSLEQPLTLDAGQVHAAVLMAQ